MSESNGSNGNGNAEPQVSFAAVICKCNGPFPHAHIYATLELGGESVSERVGNPFFSKDGGSRKVDAGVRLGALAPEEAAALKEQIAALELPDHDPEEIVQMMNEAKAVRSELEALPPELSVLLVGLAGSDALVISVGGPGEGGPQAPGGEN